MVRGQASVGSVSRLGRALLDAAVWLGLLAAAYAQGTRWLGGTFLPVASALVTVIGSMVAVSVGARTARLLRSGNAVSAGLGKGLLVLLLGVPSACMLIYSAALVWSVVIHAQNNQVLSWLATVSFLAYCAWATWSQCTCPAQQTEPPK